MWFVYFVLQIMVVGEIWQKQKVATFQIGDEVYLDDNLHIYGRHIITEFHPVSGLVKIEPKFKNQSTTEPNNNNNNSGEFWVSSLQIRKAD
jgi:hypothetical protein